ncbi:SDR family NAD(P)-dependent oxidoreductase [Rhodococcus sp. IEGM 1366]|uniref:SDR family NAD(P)-dependent oxidoreductase n=1 Tax=Rhodococcus sp. IEGM 1366 TaxID=3082223 RepID=UPI0029538519|nr:SDR family NAD(P)-dependent oxidoreductase [Rhodococcus sp. IEGM 1366]MDV8071386.1 SDR family NAD(P)-dependent oxidoreductase [Rhodococcus sp. IEGM 1366]
MSTTRLHSGTAVITGGGSGIGEGFARHLASRGMHVVVTDIDADRAESVAHDIRTRGGQASAYQVDVTDFRAVERLAATTFETHGSVELLLNNAGIESGGLLWETSIDRWAQVMSINVTGVFHGVRAFLPRMIELAAPAVVANMSSVGGVSTTGLQAPYIVSKHAVLALTECLHQEIALVGAPIQVSAILPAQVRSQIFTAAQSSAPPADELSRRVFDWMQSVNASSSAPSAVDAAAHMTDQLADGQFWVFSDEEIGRGAAAARGSHLSELRDPVHPRETFAQAGFEL